MKNLSKTNKLGLIVSIVLSAIVLLCSIQGIIESIQIGKIIPTVVCNLAIIALTQYYVFFGYKKPHGNLLKTTYFCFAVYLTIHAYLDNSLVGPGIYKYKEVVSCFMIFAALIIAFVSGRLNKIDKNKKLLIVAGLLMSVDTILHIITMNNEHVIISKMISYFNPLIIFAVLRFVYTIRYEEHIDAGLEDK